MDIDVWLQERFAVITPHLDEKQRRLVAAADVRFLGHGGVSRVARATGMSRPTIYEGLKQLDAGVSGSQNRVRRVGGGRKRICEQDVSILRDLELLVDPVARGDPKSPLRWTCKSTRQLAQALVERGHKVSHRVVADLLRWQGYSLQANRKTLEGSSHPDRDAQFSYLSEQVTSYLAQGLPVISVDTKKKELVGQYKNNGKEWYPQGNPEEVNVHDFLNPDLGKAIPYGIYDIGNNLGWVNVGCDHDTSSFAVASIRRWWSGMGSPLYPVADSLLICADSGGSNGYRVRLWKAELQAFANATGLKVTVCHLPPGTSKWNKIEHRLFSHISMNWRGRPLVSHEVIVDLIAATTTQTGLRVEAEFDQGNYPTNIKVADADMAKLRLERHAFHGEWNYSIQPEDHGFDD